MRDFDKDHLDNQVNIGNEKRPIRSKVKEFAEEAADSVTEGAKRIGRRMIRTGETIVDKTKHTSKKVEKFAEDTAHNVADTARRVGYKVRKTGENIADRTKIVSRKIDELGDELGADERISDVETDNLEMDNSDNAREMFINNNEMYEPFKDDENRDY
ncbi:hypothetical protein KHQ82_05950 [Mycoplasmatota bacterium]|nr:hypothetical protein KHQ82_05950 [Mycoplasmatota bacterium]